MLETLELFGFKSFADRTKFDFAPGVTCVVGPNGSGKSNVVDAIKWILGDQSAKSLRGKEMTDVIFNGASNRKPAGFAEAMLTFNNAKRVLSVDADQVQIGRRIYRSGEAEYLINRVPARLKDIRELFMGTGAGTSAYSIIEQGRVDQLLQATATARRIVFEEAAGVSKFKVRKVDAERKLERVAQNLLRLTDIVKEVEGQLLTMRSQAVKAARFRELSVELKTLRVGLAADDYRELTARLKEIEAERGGLNSQVEQLNSEAQASEARQKAADQELSDVEDRLRAAERREAEFRETAAGHEATIRHQRARRQELEAEFTRLEQQQTELTQRAEQVAGELEQTVDHLRKFSDEYDRRKAALSEAEEAIRGLAAQAAAERAACDRQRETLLACVRQTSVLGNRVAACDTQHAGQAAARDKARLTFERLEQDVITAALNVTRQQALIDAQAARMAALRDALKGVQAQRNELAAGQSDIQQRLVELREQRSAVQARRDLLEDLERRQEGLGVGVKEILNLSREAQGPPWNHVLGHVVDLLEVDLENAALLEVALGNRAQLFVLDEAGPLIDFLNAGTCKISGRVGFMALEKDAAGAELEPSPDLSGTDGVINRADRLVRSAAGIHRLAEQLLADTWIVSTLDVALALAAELPERYRYVTLQGELLESNGLLYVGSVRSESALVSRKSELRGIKQNLQRLDRQIANEESASRQVQTDLRETDARWQHLQTELDDCTSCLSELKSTAGSQELDLERLERSHQEVETELARLDQELAELLRQREAAQSDLARAEAAAQELQTQIEQREQAALQFEQQRRQRQDQLATEQMDLAKGEERLHNLEHARSRLDQERFQRDLHKEEAESRYRVLHDKCRQIDAEIDSIGALLAELAVTSGQVKGEVTELQALRDAARAARGEVAERELRARHLLRDGKERWHTLEIKASEIQHQLLNLAERLRDEYQLDVAEVSASDVSAKQAWLEAQQQAQPAPGNEAPGHDVPASADEGEPPAGGRIDPAGEPTDGELPAAQAPAPDQAAAVRDAIEEKINRNRRKLKQLGQVNVDSLRELDDLESRYAKLSAQLQDLVEAKSTLEEIIRRVNSEGRRIFIETFTEIRKHFQELFRKLFGGGEGDVVLEDPEDVLECGIDIVARPPGKELRSISLLSGGEKTMTAVALLLAIFKSRPSPFCILDEVDAALDEGNVERYLGVIREFQQWTQFIVITHSKRTMSGADVLYGVTMESAGVSKRMSVRFEDIAADGQIKASATAAPVEGGRTHAA